VVNGEAVHPSYENAVKYAPKLSLEDEATTWDAAA
jgi:hypothetical protein